MMEHLANERPWDTVRHPSSIAGAIGIVLITFIVYAASLTNDFVHFDDPYLILSNPTVEGITPANIGRAFTQYDPELYIPLTFLSYQIDYQIAGKSPFMFHLTNLIVHAINALLVSWLALLLTKQRKIALFCGIAFVLHPLNTEAVVWASARKDVLCSMWFLGSIIAYLLFRSHRSARAYRTSIVLFLLALFSKVLALSLPGILILIELAQGRRLDKEMLREKIPYIALSVLFGIIALGGKTDMIQATTMGTRILMAAKSTAFYLEKLILPVRLSVLYPYTDSVRLLSPDFLFPLLVIVTITLACVRMMKTDRRFICTWGCFVLLLLPTFVNFNKGAGYDEFFFASDRYAYLPSIVFFLVVATTGFALRQRMCRLNTWPWGTVVAGCFVLVLAFLSHLQSLVWKDTTTLFTHAIALNDNSHLAHNTLGAVELSQGHVDEAYDHFSRSLAIRPTARAHYNRALIHLEREEFAEAIVENQKAIDLMPTHAAAWMNLGVTRWQMGEKEEGLHAVEHAATLDAKDPDILATLAAMYLSQGQWEEAATTVTAALQLDPTHEHAQSVLRALEQAQGMNKK